MRGLCHMVFGRIRVGAGAGLLDACVARIARVACLVCLASAPFAATPSAPAAARLIPQDIFSSTRRVEVSIPYPNAGMYLYRGIYGSFAGGGSRERDSSAVDAWREPLFQWQGEVGYFYTEWFSGGFGFRINAGAPSDSQQTVKNRYFLLTRIHKAWPSAAVFGGIHLGVDDVSFSLSSGDTAVLTKPLRETNAGLGFEVGGGWKFSRYVGATLGQRMDVSLVRQSAGNPHRTVNFMSQPGLALDLLRVHPPLGAHVKALYVFSELQFGRTLTEHGLWTRQFAWITGLSAAF